MSGRGGTFVPPPSTCEASVFAGPGEIRARCRQIDWAATSLGPVEQWSPALGAAIRLCLDSPMAMAVWAGSDLQLIYNQAYVRALGPEGHPHGLGRPGREVWASVWSELGPVLDGVMTGGEPVYEVDQGVRMPTGNGVETTYHTYSHNPIRGDDGRIVGILSVGHNTTERVRLQRDLRRMFELSHDLLAVVGTDDRFRRVNAAFTRLLGWTEEEVLARTCGFFLHPDDRSRTQEALGNLVDGTPLLHFENRHLHKDGSYRWLSWTAVPVPEDGLIYAAARDVTESKRVADRLRDTDRRKDEFLAMLGHELRNPLAGIRSATQLLELSAPESGRLRRVHGVLERQSGHMSRLIDGLLEVSRIARGKIVLEREILDVRGLVEEQLLDRAAEFEAAGVSSTVSLPAEPRWVSADRVRLAQVLGNILGNAIKFTDSGGSVGVSVEGGDDEVTVRIRDTGVGIRPALLERLFEPFQQEAQEIDRHRGGLGLGLAVARGLVELHGGRIEADSPGTGGGTEVMVSLPRVEPPAELGDRRGPDPVEPCKILLVEDNPDAAETLRELLQLSGHQVSLAGTGREALDVMRETAVDVVLCDLGLPGMSGFDVAQAVRDNEAIADTLLVAVTGYGQPEDQRRSEAAGFDAHLTKPVDIGDIQHVIELLRADAPG